MNRLLAILRRSMTGKLLVAALIVLLAAYAARVYLVDQPRQRAEEERLSGIEQLEAMADALEELVDRRGAESLPARTDWYPAELPCATKIPFGPTNQPLWAELGLDENTETAFQVRFDLVDDEFTLWTRRDSDCDGWFAVWTISGSADGASILGRTTVGQNTTE